MSLSDTWRAPLNLLEQDLWTVEQSFLVCRGYIATEEFDTYEFLERNYPDLTKEEQDKIKEAKVKPLFDDRSKLRKHIDKVRKNVLGTDIPEERELDHLDMLSVITKKTYYSIATGEKFEGDVDEIELSFDTLIRFWINTAHDTDERKFSPGDGSYMEEKWTKTYLIGWALRHRVELPWLNDAIKYKYVTGIPVQKSKEPRQPWEIKPVKRERDFLPQLNEVLEFYLTGMLPPPSPLEVLEYWKSNYTKGIHDITDNSFCYSREKLAGKKSDPVSLSHLQDRINSRIKYI